MKEKLNYKVFYGNGTTLISNVALHLFQTWDFVHLWSNHDFHGPSKHPSLLVTRKLLPSCVRLLQFCLNFVNNFQQSYEPFIDLFFVFSFHFKNLTHAFLFFSNCKNSFFMKSFHLKNNEVWHCTFVFSNYNNDNKQTSILNKLVSISPMAHGLKAIDAEQWYQTW